MVKSNSKIVFNGLYDNEKIVFDWTVPRRTGFLKSDKMIAIVTNKRFILAYKDTMKIDYSYNLEDIKIVITNVVTENYGSRTETHGIVEFWMDGEKKLWLTENNPCRILSTIELLQKSLIIPKDTNTDQTNFINSEQSTQKYLMKEKLDLPSDDLIKIFESKLSSGEFDKSEITRLKKMFQ
jgi:hypothetical protein